MSSRNQHRLKGFAVVSTRKLQQDKLTKIGDTVREILETVFTQKNISLFLEEEDYIVEASSQFQRCSVILSKEVNRLSLKVY